jgi:hypothetical protein
MVWFYREVDRDRDRRLLPLCDRCFERRGDLDRERVLRKNIFF